MTSAELDFDRFARRGYAEAILCQGKTLEQCVEIAGLWRQRVEGSVEPLGHLLFTRASPDQAAAVVAALPGAHHDALAGMVVWPAKPPTPQGGQVLVACAGTADLPVAREAALTARFLGREVDELVDVGVAGLDRILCRRGELRRADVIVVVAGMDGALVPVVAGLVSCPVVAVPTSVGYGANFDGLSALLTMLNTCAPGVGVVNIDNGYGAGHLAAQIAAPRASRDE